MSNSSPKTLASTDGMTADEILSACFAWLCTPRGGNNFWGRVLNGCDRRVVPGIRTMAVGLTPRGRYAFSADPEFLLSKPIPVLLRTFIHEAAHLGLSHLERIMRYRLVAQHSWQWERYIHLFNIAADFAVNDTVLRETFKDPKLTAAEDAEYRKEFIWPEDEGFPTGKSFEEYVVLLLDKLKADGKDINAPPQMVMIDMTGMPGMPGQKGEGSSCGGSETGEPQPGGGADSGEDSNGHDPSDTPCTKQSAPPEEDFPEWFKEAASKATKLAWQDVFKDATQGEVERALDNARKTLSGIMKRAAEATQKSRGTVPASMLSIIEELLKEPTVTWQEVLRGTLRSSISRCLEESTVMPSMALLHQDGFMPYPGTQPKMTFNLMALFDTSGSMSDSDFADCCSELAGLVRDVEGVKVRLVMFDAGLQHEQDVDDEDEDFQSLRAKARYGRGGTCFDEPIKVINDTDDAADWIDDAERLSDKMRPVDLGIIFTDGYAPEPRVKTNVPLLWCLTAQGAEEPWMGHTIRMEE